MPNEPKGTIEIRIGGSDLAIGELQSFADFLDEFFETHGIAPSGRDEVVAAVFPEAVGLPPAMRVAPYRRALRLQDEEVAKQLFPGSPKPLDSVALALCCLAEKWLHDLCDIEKRPNGKGSSRWWQLMFWLARVQGDIDAHIAGEHRWKNQQRNASKLARAKGDIVRAAVLNDFDARVREWSNYMQAAEDLWSKHQGPPGATMVWNEPKILRTFLSGQRKGAYPNVGGRPRGASGTPKK